MTRIKAIPCMKTYSCNRRLFAFTLLYPLTSSQSKINKVSMSIFKYFVDLICVTWIIEKYFINYVFVDALFSLTLSLSLDLLSDIHFTGFKYTSKSKFFSFSFLVTFTKLDTVDKMLISLFWWRIILEMAIYKISEHRRETFFLVKTEWISIIDIPISRGVKLLFIYLIKSFNLKAKSPQHF